MSEIAVGIAGFGRFGRLHAGVIRSLGNARVAAIYDPDPVAASAATQFGDPDVVTSFRELLSRTDLDCVYIVSPEDTHEQMVDEAIERRLPIFLEKPLALSSARGAEIVARSTAAGVYVQVGFVLRFEARSAFLRDQILNGSFGQLVTFRAKRNCSRAWFDIYADRAHAVYETVIHDIDYLLWIAGSRCTSVYAIERHLSGRRYPDATMAMLTFENGLMAAIETSWLVPGQAPANVLTDNWHGTIDAELEIVGEHRSARFRGLESGLEIWSDANSHHLDAGLWPEINGAVAGAIKAEDEHFLQIVASGERVSGVASIDDAVEGLRIAEAIVESAARGEIVRL
ncbi:MAG: Gfo/Idh/MocA family protein [Thermomicrobiales bacterium]